MQQAFLRRCNALVSRSRVVAVVLAVVFAVGFLSALTLHGANLTGLVEWVLMLPLAAAAYVWCSRRQLLTWGEVLAALRQRGAVLALRWALGYFGSSLAFMALGMVVVWGVRVLAAFYPPPSHASVDYAAIVLISWLFPLVAHPWYAMLAVVVVTWPGTQIGGVFRETWRHCRRWLGACLLLGLVSAVVSRGVWPAVMMVTAPWQPLSLALSRALKAVTVAVGEVVAMWLVLVSAGLVAREDSRTFPGADDAF